MSRTFKGFVLLVMSLILLVFGGPESVVANAVLSVHGNVLNLYGQPIDNVEVELDGQRTTTSSEGAFSFREIREGNYELAVFPDSDVNHTVQTVRVAPNLDPLTVYVKDDDNPIVNPGIELVEDDTPLHWQVFAPEGDAKALSVTTEVKTGQYALLIDVDEAKRLKPDLNTIRMSWSVRRTGLVSDTYGWAEPGEIHTVSFYYKTEGDPKLRLGIERRLLEPKLTGSIVDNTYQSLPPSEDWIYHEFDFEWPHPDTHTDWFIIHFFSWGATDGKIWIDDVKLSHKKAREGETEGSEVYILNPNQNTVGGCSSTDQNISKSKTP